MLVGVVSLMKNEEFEKSRGGEMNDLLMQRRAMPRPTQ